MTFVLAPQQQRACALVVHAGGSPIEHLLKQRGGFTGVVEKSAKIPRVRFPERFGVLSGEFRGFSQVDIQVFPFAFFVFRTREKNHIFPFLSSKSIFCSIINQTSGNVNT